MNRTKARRRSVHATRSEDFEFRATQPDVTNIHGAFGAFAGDKYKEVKFPQEINKLDLGTEDEWIHRDPALIRLTGRHPLNAEPPIDKLMSYGTTFCDSLGTQ